MMGFKARNQGLKQLKGSYFFLEGPFFGYFGRPGFAGEEGLRALCQAGFCRLSILRGIVF
jgi:hypothetical protein